MRRREERQQEKSRERASVFAWDGQIELKMPISAAWCLNLYQ